MSISNKNLKRIQCVDLLVVSLETQISLQDYRLFNMSAWYIIHSQHRPDRPCMLPCSDVTHIECVWVCVCLGSRTQIVYRRIKRVRNLLCCALRRGCIWQICVQWSAAVHFLGDAQSDGALLDWWQAAAAAAAAAEPHPASLCQRQHPLHDTVRNEEKQRKWNCFESLFFICLFVTRFSVMQIHTSHVNVACLQLMQGKKEKETLLCGR